jgi:hypothetical protein
MTILKIVIRGARGNGKVATLLRVSAQGSIVRGKEETAMAGIPLPFCRTLTLLAVLAAPALAAEPGKQAPPANTDQVRRAVQRSLPFLEKEGLAWMAQRKCIACHHGPFLLWSHNEARRRGFAVDTKKLDAWTDQAVGLFLNGLKGFQQKKNGNVEATNMLLGQVVPPTGASKATQGFRNAAAVLANGQKPGGWWKYEGQGQRRPDAAADEATTLWAALALTSVEKWDAAYPKLRDRSLAWLKDNHKGAGNEPAALRLVIATQFGNPQQVAELARALIARQNVDGGWSWGKDFPSDPYATGQSLYALGRAGRNGDDPAVRKAWQFLLARQRADGSWYAPTKKPTKKDNPIASYWGTAWATIGLVKTLPAKTP